VHDRQIDIMLPFFTIGHSTRSIAEFVAILQGADVTLVVDIRTVPRSRTNPQYNKDSLPLSLEEYGIGYVHLAELGGLPGKAKTVAPETNGFWQNQSFHNYADQALSEAFHRGLDKLIALGREQRLAMMCSEAVWWRCHRRLVADNLIARGEAVFHLMGHDRIECATLTKGAHVSSDGVVTYPVEAALNQI
jgi:uncharacterized protein (DUF488 family)